ncbi:MAG: bifunctional riboflavin kinase/FAD synthetase [Prevotella sp.]|jgi:riboflavin kinase/FMN adenylyltransferase
MKIIYLNQDHNISTTPCVATLGFFDGVHLGHRFLIEQVIAEARLMGLASMVITFDRHPREVLHRDYQPELLTTLDSKLKLLERTGVDYVVVLHFDEATAMLPAKEFMSHVLRNRLNVEKLVIGYDNKFGHNPTDVFDDYVEYGRELGMEVAHNSAFKLNGIEISSSVVRTFLKEGEVELARRCLSYPYTITGKVVDGYKEGRKMGYPTANLDMQNSGQLVPANGVYAVQVRIGESELCLPGMTDIGVRPTFGGKKRTLETYIFNFNEDIYGKQISLSFIKRIREERKFDNVTLLVEQLKEDERMIEELFNNKKDRDE